MHMGHLGLVVVDLSFMQPSRSTNASLAILCSLCVTKLHASIVQFNVFELNNGFVRAS